MFNCSSFVIPQSFALYGTSEHLNNIFATFKIPWSVIIAGRHDQIGENTVGAMKKISFWVNFLLQNMVIIIQS